MSKVNLNIAYLGQKGANINLGKIDDIEITSSDNSVEVVDKSFDPDTKILTFDLKAAKSQSITSADTSVSVTEDNGNVDLSVAQVNVVPLNATTSVEESKDDKGNKTFAVGAFSTHTVMQENNIVKPNPMNASPKPDWLKSYVVKCEIVDKTYEFFDTNSMEKRFPANMTATHKITWNVDLSSELQYINFAQFSASSFFARMKITITTQDGVSQEHYISLAQDTPDDATFTFITTLNWNIHAFVSPMTAFIEIPSGFAGTITAEVEYAFAFSGDWFAYTYYDTAAGKEKANSYFKDVADEVGKPLSYEQYQTKVASYVSIDGYSDLQQKAGRYKVDGLFPMDGWEVGKKIPDSLPNDIMLHQLQIYVRQLEIDYATLVKQINFSSEDGSINVKPKDGGGTDYTVNWSQMLANGVLEITDENKADYYNSETEIISNLPPNTHTIVFNSARKIMVSAIQGGNYNGRRITLVGNYSPSERYAVENKTQDGRFSEYLYEYRVGVEETGELHSGTLEEAYEEFVYYNGIWYSKGY